METLKETLEELNSSTISSEKSKDVVKEEEDLQPSGKKRKLENGKDARGCRVVDGVIPFPASQPSHTGYLTSATLLPVLSS